MRTDRQAAAFLPISEPGRGPSARTALSGPARPAEHEANHASGPAAGSAEKVLVLFSSRGGEDAPGKQTQLSSPRSAPLCPGPGRSHGRGGRWG